MADWSFRVSPHSTSPKSALPKKVSFPDNAPVRLRPTKSSTTITHSVKPRFKPLFVSLRTDLSNKRTKTRKFHKSETNLSLLSTNPTFDKFFEAPLHSTDDGLYSDDSHNRLDQRNTLLSQTKLRTLSNLANLLKNRPNPSSAAGKKMRRTKTMLVREHLPATRELSIDSYDAVVRMLRETQAKQPPMRKTVKVMVDLPKLPFGKHVSYNSVLDFPKTHILNLAANGQLMDKLTAEIWVSKLNQRRSTEPEAAKTPQKPEYSCETEQVRLYNSRLKVAEENLYLHYSIGSSAWKRDMLEKRLGWRSLYRLQRKRLADPNLTFT